MLTPEELYRLLWNFAEAIDPSIGSCPDDLPEHTPGTRHAYTDRRVAVYQASRALAIDLSDAIEED